MKAGSAQVDITPPVGRAILGQMMRRTAAGVHDPLFASALALESHGQALVLVACDVAVVDDALVSDVRKRVARATGIAGERVWVSATHTHTGPAILGLLGTNTDKEYRYHFSGLVVRAALQAWDAREDAVLGMAARPAPGWTFPRRYRMRDGTVRTHPPKGSPDVVRPEGAADDDLGVLWARAQGASGRLLGALVSFGSHPIVVGGESVYSADYPGAVRTRIQAAEGTGAAVLFGNGPCGDTCPIEVERPDKREYGFEWVERMGQALGGTALELVAGGGEAADPPVAAMSAAVEVPTRAPEPAALAEARSLLQERALEPEPEAPNLVWPREALLWEQEWRSAPVARLEVAAARIGSGALVTLPGEVFAALGREIKDASAFRPTLVIELANGYCGYVPTAEAFGGGGCETRLARSSKLAPVAGARVVNAAAGLLRRLAAA